MEYDRLTRWLHACIVATILVQLISSGLMEIPKPGRAVPAWAATVFEIHESSGMTVLLLVMLHWIWGLVGRGGGLGRLFPWLSREGRSHLSSDLKSMPLWIRGGGAGEEPMGASLAGMVHGLGLLAATGMALSGSILFFGIGPDGAMSRTVHSVKEFHEFLANFLWAFLAGHVAMALLHQWQGDRILTRMFNLSQR